MGRWGKKGRKAIKTPCRGFAITRVDDETQVPHTPQDPPHLLSSLPSLGTRRAGHLPCAPSKEHGLAQELIMAACCCPCSRSAPCQRPFSHPGKSASPGNSTQLRHGVAAAACPHLSGTEAVGDGVGGCLDTPGTSHLPPPPAPPSQLFPGLPHLPPQPAWLRLGVALLSCIRTSAGRISVTPTSK